MANRSTPAGDVLTDRPLGGGKRRKVPPAERLKRRAAIAAMMAAGVEEPVIKETMAGEQFGMTRAATKRLMNLVVRQWADDEAEQRPRLKQMAVRRLLGHVASAKKAGAWGAVASFERILSEVQGTREPDVVEHRVTAELRAAVSVVVQGLTPDRMLELADRALSYRGERPLAEPRVLEAPALDPAPAAE